MRARGWRAVGLALLLALGVARTGEAQFWGFDLPRPGRSLAKAPPPNESHSPHPSVVRVVVDERTSLSHGTGVLVGAHDQYALVLTNWHVVRDVAGSVNVIFPSGFTSPARIVKVDKDWDLAALGIWNPNVAPLPIARTPPRVGESLTIAGYGSGQYRAITGRCNQFLSPGEKFPYEMVEVSVEARRGDSGGPILNQRGEVAGILFGASTGTTSGSHSGRVRRFLTPWLAIVDRPATAVAAAGPGAGALQVPPTTTGSFAAAGGTIPTSERGEDSGAALLAPQPGLGAPAAAPAGAGIAASAQRNPAAAAPFGAPSEPFAPIVPGSAVAPLERPGTTGIGLAPVPIAGNSLNADTRAAAALDRPAASGGRSAAFGNADGAGGGGDGVKPKRTETAPLDHLKNVLAIVGVLAVIFHLFRRPAAAPAEDDDE